MKNKFISLGLAIATTLGFASCTNELSWPTEKPNDSTINLVKSPDVVAYSGNQVLGSTYGTKTMSLPSMYATRSETPTFTKWQSDTKIEGWPEKTDRDEAVSTQEFNYVMKYLAEHPNEGSLECDVMPYFLQLVGKSHATYHEPFIKDDGDVHHYADIDGSSQMDYFEINGVHINDYNGEAGPWIYVENLPLINPRYHESYNNLTQENHYRFYTIPNEDGNGYSLYLCFDYATSKYDNGQLDFDGDGIYNDWVIKIIPGNGLVTPPNQEGNCEICGHDHNSDEVCEECPEGEVCNPKDSNTPSDTPDVVIPSETPEHVEINLSIEERDGVEWLASHLSIHVRANTDVEVFIPLPAKFYCAVDDMAIVQKHEEDLMIHGGPKTTNFTLGGFNVQLTVAFESEGIRVTTNGITQEVIDYCQETYGDGITFEVWNYMNLKVKDWSDKSEHGQDILGYGQENQITVDELRGYLNQSTVEFTNTPSLYVNAFMYLPGCEEDEHTCDRFVDDCTVSIVEEQKSLYEDGKTDYWFNGSPYNELYYKSGEE